MKEILETLITAIVEHPEEVAITEEENEGVVTFTISVNKDDIGKVIGKEGKVIRALRTLMKIPAMRENKKIYLSLHE